MINTGTQKRMRALITLTCRACGSAACSRFDAEELVGKNYKLFESSEIRVWHPDCAVGDGRVDSIDDLDGDQFYYEIRE